jgi:ATP-dependent exoDNAse (exonuclease V) beta subunit
LTTSSSAFQEEEIPKEKVLPLQATQLDLFPDIKKDVLPFFIIKPTYSVSELETFLRCEKEYELKYSDGILALGANTNNQEHSRQHRSDDAGKHHLPAQTWGLLIHEIFQFLDFSTFLNKQTVIDQAFVNQRIQDTHGHITKKINDLIVRIADKKEAIDLLQTNLKSSTEVGFLLDLKEFYIRGTMDRLVHKENALVVLDYKTDTLRSMDDLASRIKTYWGQMACYALATHEIFKTDSVQTTLLFTDGPFVHTQQWNREELENARTLLLSTHASLQEKYPAGVPIEKISQNKSYPADKSICLHCSYYELNYCGVKNLA